MNVKIKTLFISPLFFTRIEVWLITWDSQNCTELPVLKPRVTCSEFEAIFCWVVLSQVRDPQSGVSSSCLQDLNPICKFEVFKQVLGLFISQIAMTRKTVPKLWYGNPRAVIGTVDVHWWASERTNPPVSEGHAVAWLFESTWNNQILFKNWFLGQGNKSYVSEYLRTITSC